MAKKKRRSHRKPSPAQLAARKRFAEMARSGALKRKRNPKGRAKRRLIASQRLRHIRVDMSGRKITHRGGRGFPGNLARRVRLPKTSDPRKFKRAIRRAGYRVNPRRRKAHIGTGPGAITLQKKLPSGWQNVMAFFSLAEAKAAIRKVHRAFPRNTYRLVRP